MSQACSRAMRPPEIVSIVLEKVQGTNALFAALQVPRLWADEATMALWREGSPTQTLIHVRHAQRVNITPIRFRPWIRPVLGNVERKLFGITTTWCIVRFLSGRLSLTSIRLRCGLEDVASDELYIALL